MITKEQNDLLYLVRLGIGGNPEPCLDFSGVEWRALLDLAHRHGVAAIALDGLQKVYESGGTDAFAEMGELRYEWCSRCLSMEQDYLRYVGVIEHLALFYAKQDIPMMLLKGYGLSLNYPVPGHRPSGDIDIYLWHLWEFADEMVAKKLGIDGALFQTPERFSDFSVSERTLVDRVLSDILQREYQGEKGKGVIKYVWSRWKNWLHNRWKHKIVYSDSLFSTFFAQFLSHLMKPASLKGSN